jgi:hypothetical protein
VNVKKLNWPLWIGLVLTFFAGLSYPLIFVWYAFTRDFPWANLVLFAIALIFIALGLRRAFASGLPHPWRSRIVGSLVAGLSLAMTTLFLFGVFVFARWLPESKGAPQVGQKAPEFTLPDANNKPVALTELLTMPINGKAPKGALLIFYRGYW